MLFVTFRYNGNLANFSNKSTNKTLPFCEICLLEINPNKGFNRTLPLSTCKVKKNFEKMKDYSLKFKEASRRDEVNNEGQQRTTDINTNNRSLTRIIINLCLICDDLCQL